MSETVLLLITSLICLGIGTFIGITFFKLKSKSENSALQERQQQFTTTISDLKKTIEKVEAEREEIRREKEFLNAELARKNAEYESLQQQNSTRDETIKKQQEQLRKDFELLANKIFDEKSERLTHQNKENIKTILDPLQEKIKEFKEKVEVLDKDQIRRHSDLQSELKSLKDLNRTISDEAQNLTKALKGDKKLQGSWGELILEKVLENSGLENNREYSKQKSFTDASGNRQLPDYIINLPDNRKIIVDSKVSLVAYEQFINEDDEELQATYLKNHIKALWNHVEDLSDKSYHQLYHMESPDYVLMFIPIETAFSAAVNEKPRLYDEAFLRNIVIVTPSTLLATLKTIDTMWQHDKQRRNTIEIARQAGQLHDKFVALIEDYTKIERQLQTVQNTLSASKIKLTGKGSISSRIHNLKLLGAKASKEIGREWIDDSPAISEENSTPENPDKDNSEADLSKRLSEN